MSEHTEAIKKFVDICGTSEEEAKHLLEAHEWNDAAAISAFFADEADNNSEVVAEAVSVPAPPPVFQRVVPEVIKVKPQSADRVVTLSSLNKNESAEDDDSGEEGQAFYVGGSERGGGGQQVLGPRRKDLPRPGGSRDKAIGRVGMQSSTSAGRGGSEDLVHNIFQTARERGAEELDTTRVLDQKNLSKKTFVGTGYRLGEETDAEAQVVSNTTRETSDATTATAGGNQSSEEMQVIVKMWRNGFSLNDGPLRLYSDPESRVFLDAIQRGEVPRELTQRAHGEQVDLLLEDHHHEEWQAPPPPKHKAFTGTGQMLGCPTPNVVKSGNSLGTSASASAGLKTNNGDATNASTSFDVDTTQPVTQLQVRTADGSRFVVKMNQTQTVADLRRAIICQRPQLDGTSFVMMSTFPNRELKEETLTLTQANLLNSSIVLKTI